MKGKELWSENQEEGKQRKEKEKERKENVSKREKLKRRIELKILVENRIMEWTDKEKKRRKKFKLRKTYFQLFTRI